MFQKVSHKLHCTGIACGIGNIRGSSLEKLGKSEFLTSTSYNSKGIAASDTVNSAIESAVSGEPVRIKFEPFRLTTDGVTSENAYQDIS